MNEKGLLKEFGKYASLNVSGMIGCYLTSKTQKTDKQNAKFFLEYL